LFEKESQELNIGQQEAHCLGSKTHHMCLSAGCLSGLLIVPAQIANKNDKIRE